MSAWIIEHVELDQKRARHPMEWQHGLCLKLVNRWKHTSACASAYQPLHHVLAGLSGISGLDYVAGILSGLLDSPKIP